MSKKALLDAVPGRQTIIHEEDGRQFIESRQDVEHIIKAAAIVADEPPGKDFRHAAYIPESVMNGAMTDGWFHDPLAWKRWANDPDNRQYRTWKGRL